MSEKRGQPLNRLTVQDYKSVDKAFGDDVLGVFDLGKAMKRRAVVGAPGTNEVKKQIGAWRKKLGGLKDGEGAVVGYEDNCASGSW